MTSNSRISPSASADGSRPIHQHEHAPGFRVYVEVNASGARDTGPSGSESSATLDELALQYVEELRALMGVTWKTRSHRAANDLHLPPVGRRDVLQRTPAANVDGRQGISCVFTDATAAGSSTCIV
jgi:hypothetical protein